jgi:hypothetical protein
MKLSVGIRVGKWDIVQIYFMCLLESWRIRGVASAHFYP